MIIKGKKIYLKEGLEEKNYSSMLEWFKDLEVVGHISWGQKASKFKTTEEIKKFYARLQDGIILGIYTKNHKFIGYTNLHHFESKEVCKFGIFILDKNYWGKGIGSEATKIMVDYAFGKLGMKKIMLSTSELHSQAIKLYKKAGFQKKKLIPSARKIYSGNKWIPCGTITMEIENIN